jgi:hypothetical protein
MRSALLLFALVCCGNSEEKPNPLTTKEGPAAPLDHPPIDVPQTKIAASPQRLTVSQLEASWAVALGKDKQGRDITWRLPDGTPGLARYARTLGEPDYLVSTEQNLEPSTLYAKFIDDAARSVCDQAIEADKTRTEKVITRHEDVAQNLRYLKLRMHGIQLDDVKPLQDLYQKAGWRGVCVALVSAPEFHLY